MRSPPYLMDERRREAVLQAITSVCEFRGWTLFAAHVRTNHVHAIVEIDGSVEEAAQDFKTYASRSLNESGIDAAGQKRWTRHASVRRVMSDEARERAIRYVAVQGEPLAVYVRPERS